MALPVCAHQIFVHLLLINCNHTLQIHDRAFVHMVSADS